MAVTSGGYLSTGTLDGTLEGMASGALSGAITGAIVGGISGGISYKAPVTTQGTPQAVGKAGEQAAGINGPKQPIDINSRIRIPDGLTDSTLTEVKNVKYLSKTQQLDDFITYSQNNGLKMELWVRKTTTMSNNLLDTIDKVGIIVKRLPW